MLSSRLGKADINSRESFKRAYAERQSVNTVIQGSAADMMKCAMLEIRSRLEECGMLERKEASIIMQIHDEIGAFLLFFCSAN